MTESKARYRVVSAPRPVPTVGALRSMLSGVLREARRRTGMQYPFPQDCKLCGGTGVVSPDEDYIDQRVRDYAHKHGLSVACACTLGAYAGTLGTDHSVREMPIALGEMYQGQRSAIIAVRDLLLSSKPPSTIVFGGEPGVGKTITAMWLAWRFSPLVAMPSPAWRASLRVGEVHKAVEQLLRYPLLIFDEVGGSFDSVSHGSILLLHRVIDGLAVPRKRGEQAVLCITNFRPNELEQHVGGQLAHRLSPKRGAAWVVLSKDKAEVVYG